MQGGIEIFLLQTMIERERVELESLGKQRMGGGESGVRELESYGR